MSEFNFKQYLKEGKLIKENREASDDFADPSVDSNVAYLVGQIADDMMYGEFDSKEDINKFLDSIITGVEELRSQQLLNFKEITYLPDANPEGDDLEEGRHGPGRRMDESNFNKSLKKASTKLKENKLKKK